MRSLYNQNFLPYSNDTLCVLQYHTGNHFKDDFTRQFGAYCAFCEVPLFGHFDVQEKLSENGLIASQSLCHLCLAQRDYYCTKYDCTYDSFLWSDDENINVFDYAAYTCEHKNLKKDIIDQGLLFFNLYQVYVSSKTGENIRCE